MLIAGFISSYFGMKCAFLAFIIVDMCNIQIFYFNLPIVWVSLNIKEKVYSFETYFHHATTGLRICFDIITTVFTI